MKFHTPFSPLLLLYTVANQKLCRVRDNSVAYGTSNFSKKFKIYFLFKKWIYIVKNISNFSLNIQLHILHHIKVKKIGELTHEFSTFIPQLPYKVKIFFAIQKQNGHMSQFPYMSDVKKKMFLTKSEILFFCRKFFLHRNKFAQFTLHCLMGQRCGMKGVSNFVT